MKLKLKLPCHVQVDGESVTLHMSSTADRIGIALQGCMFLGLAVALPFLGEIASDARSSVAAGLRHTIRGYLAASEHAEGRPELRAHLSVIRASIRLSPSDEEAFFALIEQAVEFAKSRQTPDGARLVWSSVVYPELKK